MRLTGQPTADVRVAITTDGLTDVQVDQRRARRR